MASFRREVRDRDGREIGQGVSWSKPQAGGGGYMKCQYTLTGGHGDAAACRVKEASMLDMFLKCKECILDDELTK